MKTNSHWRQRFQQPFVYKFQIAQGNPTRALLIENTSGNFQPYAYHSVSEKKQKIGSFPDGQIFGTISSDGQEIYIPNGGASELGHMYAYDFDGHGKTDLTPDAAPYVSFEVVTASQSKAVCFLASTTEDSCIFFIDRAHGLPAKTIFCAKGQFGFPACTLSADGMYCAISSSELEAGVEVWKLRLIHTMDGAVIREWQFSDGHAYALHLDVIDGSFRVLIQTNVRGFEEPAWIDSERESPSYLQTESIMDSFPLTYEPASGRLIICTVHEGKHTLSLGIGNNFPGQIIGPGHGSYDTYYGGAQFLNQSTLIARWQSSTEPADIIEIKLTEGGVNKRKYTTSLVSNTPFESITCTALDGSILQAWVARPPESKTPAPFVIDLHGGPDAVTLDAFTPEAQAWLDHGIGYCGLNYRGSISFGREFQNKIIGQPGTLESEDCISMKNELVQRGWARADCCILSGYSWGGFVTLLSLGKMPEAWAAGIAFVPIADWLVNYEKTPAYLRALDTRLFGGTPTQVPDHYIQASPSTYVENLRAPILIIAAREDVRCPIEQVESYVQKAHTYSKDVELEVYDMGHVSVFGNAQLTIPIYEKVFAFLQKKKCP